MDVLLYSEETAITSVRIPSTIPCAFRVLFRTHSREAAGEPPAIREPPALMKGDHAGPRPRVGQLRVDPRRYKAPPPIIIIPRYAFRVPFRGIQKLNTFRLP